MQLHSLTEARNPVVFTRFEAVPTSSKPGFYPGVLIIQKGPAKGHYAVKEGEHIVQCDWENPEHLAAKKYQIVIGDVTLDDVARCGAEEVNTKCKLDHGASVKDIVGNYSTFRRVGDQVRADLTLMVSADYRAYVEELFATFANKVGNSIDFDYRYEIQGDVAVARCVKLNSVDIVDAPAATNSLFNEPTNPTISKHMPLDKADLDAIGAVIDTKLSAVQTGINSRFDKIETTVTKLEAGDGEEDDEKKKKKDKEDADGEEKMSARVAKVFLSEFQKVLPKATVDNLNSLASKHTAEGTDEYADKHAQAVALGMSSAHATGFMAKKHPLLYNAKFGTAAKK